MSEPNTTLPEHDRMAEVIGKTLEPGGEPTQRELADISTRVRLEAAKAAAATVQRIGPNANVVAPRTSADASADLLRLRKWVMRAWIAAAVGMMAAAGVAIYCSLRFTQTENRTAAAPSGAPTEPAGDKMKPDAVASPAPNAASGAPAVPHTLVSPAGSEQGLWGAVPRSNAAPETSSRKNPEPETAPARTAANADSHSSAPSPSAKSSAIAPPPSTPSIPSTSSIASTPPISSTSSTPPTPPDSAAPPAAAAAGDDLIVVVMGGMPVEGFPVQPATEENFKLKLRDTGQVLTFRWNSLEDMERRRIKKLYGMEESGGRAVYGEKIAGVRLHLASGKTLDALPLPRSDANGQRAFRTANAPMLLIPAADIKSQEELACYESDFFTKHDIYERWIQDKPPAANDAAAYLDLAHKCASTGLYNEALDCLKSAELIDPRTEETNREFRTQIAAERSRALAQEIYDTALRARGNKDYLTAAECLDKLDRNFPNSELKSRWDNLRADIEKGAKQELRKRVTEMSYPVTLELIRRQMARKIKLDAKGNPVPSVPGKQVATTHGHVFRGTLQPSDGAGVLTLKVGDMELAIPRNEIVSVDDVDLSAGAKEVPPTFDELREYCTDTRRSDGLKAQMIVAIAKSLRGIGVTEKDVREIFDHRLDRPALYVGGQIISTPIYASFQDAAYGKGSWLREAAKPLPLLPDDADADLMGAAGRPRPSRGQPPGKSDENPETSDDPDVWWTAQTAETQFSILRAMAAEKIFSAKVTEVRCNDCGGTGTVSVPGPGGRPVNYRCPLCRGVKVLYKVLYE